MKRINNILKTVGLVAALAIGTTSCEDYLDVNTDPNGPSTSELVPELVLPGAQTRPSFTLMFNMNQLGNTMVSTWSGNAQQIQTPFSDEFTYQIDTDFYAAIWNNLYVRTNNLTHIINFESTQNYDYYKAAAKILKSFYFQYLVDVYGDIPYTEAHLRGDNFFPSYDNQEDVYRALVTQIDEAIALIDNTDTATVLALGSSDTMLNGDMSMWKKFGNSVKLRLLVRMMERAQTDSATETYLQDQFVSLNAAGTTFLGENEDVTINPGYSDEANKLNPFAAVYGYAPGFFGDNAQVTTSNTTVGPTVYLVEKLDGTSNGVNDPRLTRLYATRGGQTQITGNTQNGNVALPSRLGPGLLSSATQDGFIMTAAEALFLQAEAAERGYLTSAGTAQQLFDAGVRSSFNMLGANLGTYLTQANAVDGLGYTASTNKIEAIINQKFIALGGTNGLETWIEFTRTGFPDDMPLPDGAVRPARPVRILYPTSEYTGNTTNVSAFNQTIETAFDTNIFWDVN